MPSTLARCSDCTDHKIDVPEDTFFQVNGSNHVLCVSHAAQWESDYPEYTFTRVSADVAYYLTTGLA